MLVSDRKNKNLEPDFYLGNVAYAYYPSYWSRDRRITVCSQLTDSKSQRDPLSKISHVW
jgi:hypothetical protein